MALSINTRWALQTVLILTHITGLLIFLKGFFPSKVVLPGFNSFDGPSPFATTTKSKFGLSESSPEAQFDRVIVMVVDAMRSDFFYSESHSEMDFLHQLINDGNAVPFTAFSNPPTVTLPRLKGITTGGAPSFLDAILNVADDKDDSQGLGAQDSWVHQFANSGEQKKINFYGDDTWLKLFPNVFADYEGTNSFFVSDFVEVDNNVTRHLKTQIDSPSDWDGLILHYLGLDHIGHKGGPDSIFMKPKQREMDAILKRLYDYAQASDDNVLIVLLGDHGMNEVGNHGGSSQGETSAGLSFISPKFGTSLKSSYSKAPLPNDSEFTYYSRINQIDMVPTLATLLNFPIPKNNLGVVIQDFLGLWTDEAQQKQILWENCKQLMSLFEAKYPNHKDINQKWNDLQSNTNNPIDQYYNFLFSVQDILANSATNYNYNDIYLGFGLIVVSSLVLVGLFNYYFITSSSTPIELIVFFEALVAIYSLHFHGSSLIEEEHQIWWYLSISSLVLHLVYNRHSLKRSDGVYYALLAVGLRIIRSWSNSGQKFFSKVTTGSYLLTGNTSLLWALIILTYILTSLNIFVQGGYNSTFGFLNRNIGRTPETQQLGSLISFMFIFITAAVSFSFKLCQFFNDGHQLPSWLHWILSFILESYDLQLKTNSITDTDLKFKLQSINIQLAQISAYGVLGLLGLRFILGKLTKTKAGLISDFVNITTLFLIQQSRFENIPIFIVFFVVKYLFTRILIKAQPGGLNIDHLILMVSIFIICVQNLSFFSMGNTNSLATVDLSNAYNGIKSYDVFLVGVLTWISNFSAPIFWSLSSLQILLEPYEILFDKSNSSRNLIRFSFLKRSIMLIKTKVSLAFYSVAAISLVASCIHLRFHLFIWTVFSPKLLFFGAWSLLINFLVDFVVSILLVWIAE